MVLLGPPRPLVRAESWLTRSADWLEGEDASPEAACLDGHQGACVQPLGELDQRVANGGCQASRTDIGGPDLI